MTIHTTFPKGKKVHVILKDGKHLTGKFMHKKSRFVVFEIDGVPTKLLTEDIRSTSIHR